MSEIKKLTKEIANDKLAGGKYLKLQEFDSIDDGAAELIATVDGASIWLDGLKCLSYNSAILLCRGKANHLSLRGLELLDEKTAEAFSEFKGSLSIATKKPISPTIAQGLALCSGDLILFFETDDISAEVSNVLGKHKGKLSLYGIKTLTSEIAEGLCRHRGTLALNNVDCITPKAAEIICDHQGQFFLGGLKELEPDVAKGLCEYPSWLFLDSLMEIPEASAEFMAMYKGGHLTLNGLKTINKSIARSLSRMPSGLDLEGITDISEDVAVFLSQHKGWQLSLSGLQVLPSVLARHFSDHESRLCLDSLRSLSSKAADFLCLHEHEITLLSLYDSSPEVTKKLLEHPQISLPPAFYRR